MKTQIPLLQDVAPPFKHHSPTSRDAAEAILPSVGGLQWRVLMRIRQCGSFGITDEQIASAEKLNPSTARPRRIELLQRGLIRDSGKRRKTVSGRSAVVWIAT